MAKQVKKSSLAAKLGAKGQKAIAAHKSDQTDYGQGGRPPAGIEGGIAQLVDCKFDQYKKGDNTGEFFFYAAGIIVSPKTHNGAVVEGLRTSIMEPLCDTPTRSRPDVDAHFQWILNEMRKLGADTEGADIESIEALAEELKEQKPYFRFRTWKGDPATSGPYKGKEPLTNEVWSGVCEYVPEEGEDEDVVDETDEEEAEVEEDEEEEDAEEEEAPAKKLSKATKVKAAKKQTPEELAELADAGDDDAQAALTKIAEESGVDPEEYGTWAEVLVAINGEDPEEEEEEDEDEAEEAEEEEDEEQEAPAKGDVYRYKPPKAKKAVECEVMAVFAGKETCNLKNLNDETLYKSVPWSELAGD